jgi:hypothetical protein
MFENPPALPLRCLHQHECPPVIWVRFFGEMVVAWAKVEPVHYHLGWLDNAAQVRERFLPDRQPEEGRYPIRPVLNLDPLAHVVRDRERFHLGALPGGYCF